ncbi:hypothetical protein AGMMS49546_33520 [Spirochaetia bacterium]|nr:hypothetical protein AGMMS49546_33520 [Spirochaetia bacterium]
MKQIEELDLERIKVEVMALSDILGNMDPVAVLTGYTPWGLSLLLHHIADDVDTLCPELKAGETNNAKT